MHIKLFIIYMYMTPIFNLLIKHKRQKSKNIYIEGDTSRAVNLLMIIN